MPVTVNIDGRIVSEQQATISVFDHGFLYGEGVYEVLRTYRKQPFLYEPHMARLRQSAEQIALTVPWSDADMHARIAETIAASDIPGEAYIRILLTRGVGELVYDPAACPNPTTVIIIKPHVDSPAAVYNDGVTISLVPVVRNHPSSLNPRIKSNNLLNNALAMQHAVKRQAFEALMRNHRGELCECAQSNFFVVTGGVVRTAPLDAGLLAGVTRAFVLDLARGLGYRTREEALFEEDLASADEAFLTSTTREIVPVVRVDTQTIGAGVPGPITRALIAEFHRRVAAIKPAAPVTAA
jgi:branched-chain amino acid aminotransferase